MCTFARPSATTGARYTKENKNYTFNHFNPLILIPSPVLDLRDREARTNYSHVDWKAGIDYQWTSDFMTYASITTGFRGGGFNPRPFDNLQLTSFKPEKTTSFEIGEKSEWLDHTLRANAAIYFSRYRNVVITSQELDAAGQPFTGPQNVGSADIKGFELELQANPIAALELSAQVGLTDFKMEGSRHFSGLPSRGGRHALYLRESGPRRHRSGDFQVEGQRRRTVCNSRGQQFHADATGGLQLPDEALQQQLEQLCPGRRTDCGNPRPGAAHGAAHLGEQGTRLVDRRLRHESDQQVLLPKLS
jgi:outer membrane receptor protein involved in Fe transport